MFAGQTATTQAVVEAIDHEARLVTLRQQDGSTVTFTPSPDVRNLDQVSAGDILHVEISQSVSIRVAGGEGASTGAGAVSGITRSEAGEMPAMAAVDTTVIVAKVAEINIENNTYKLEMPDGSLNEYVAMNPENLKMAAVGDVVVIELTESVVAIVEAVAQPE